FRMFWAITTVSVNVSVAVIRSSPGEQSAFEEANYEDRYQAEDCVHGDQHEHDVDLEVLARVGHHPTQTLLRVDGLSEDQRQPGCGKRETQPHEEPRQGPGNDYAIDEFGATGA